MPQQLLEKYIFIHFVFLNKQLQKLKILIQNIKPVIKYQGYNYRSTKKKVVNSSRNTISAQK